MPVLEYDINKKLFKVERIIFYNKESQWGVLATEPKFDLDSNTTCLMNSYGNISITGNFAGIYEGAEIEVSGDIVDGRYGKAIQLRAFTIIHDSKSKEGVINFLARSLIKGISVQNAQKIYNTFKESSIDIVLDQPEKLKNIKGINSKTVQKVQDSVNQYKKMKPLIDFCTKLGLPYNLIDKLNKELGDKALIVVKEDPYRVLEMTSNITFRQMDEVYIKSGGDPKALTRLKTAFLYCLKNLAVLEGSTGCKSSMLKSKFYSLLMMADDGEYEMIAHKLKTEDKIEMEDDAITGYETGYVYYKPYVDIERNIAEKLAMLRVYGLPSREIREEVIDYEIHNFPFELNEQQKKAVRFCLEGNIRVLTGPAGSGKSSITKALSRIYRKSGFNVVHLSPTAKACRRLEECVGTSDAQTIHKFLGMRKDEETSSVKPFPSDTVLIVDEASMLDIILFNNLLLGTSLTSRVLLIGDNNQLPSVQAGNVLGDLIDSNRIGVSNLTDVMRQGENSSIIKYASMINKGEVFDPVELSDFHYEEFGEAEELKEFFMKKYLEEVEKYSLNEVQVITPYKKGELGMDTMNTFIQREYNKDGAITIEPYKLGDKVRHTINNYDKDVYNGETGTIISYNDTFETVLVDYGSKVITYDKQELAEVTLAYASTVHASQGSEYKVVFVILDDTAANDFLLIRRLLYTAVTRGKEKVYILTKPYLVDKCIQNNSYRPRMTRLKDLILEKCTDEDEVCSS